MCNMATKEEAGDASPSEVLVYTFRKHHNAYEEGDGSGATIIRKEAPTGVPYTIVQYFHGFILIHYFLWFIPMLFALYIPTYFGYYWVSWLMLAAYMRSYYNGDELKKGRPWPWLRRLSIWELMQSYLGLEVVREAKLDPERQYIFGTHPHGIIILSRTASYGGIFERLFPGIEQRVLGATPMFNLPGSREICLWMSAVRADKSNAIQILNQHKLNLVLYPGGSAEIFETDGESSDTIIIARKGFIRLALQSGCDLVPTFVFGEKHAYHKLNLPEKFKKFMMETLRTPLIIFWGKFFTWLPLQHDNFFLSVVYGKPIRIEKAITEPTNQEVDALYEKFYGDIQALYEKYKDRYGYSEKERLVIRESCNERMPKPVQEIGRSNGNVEHIPLTNGNRVIPEFNGMPNGDVYPNNGYPSTNGMKNLSSAKLISAH